MKKLNILLIEDEDVRIAWFKKKFYDANLYIIKDVVEFQQFNSAIHYDYVFFDHDLGNRVYVDSNDENTGYGFAKHYGKKLSANNIIIHSWNTDGAKRIGALLKDQGHRNIQCVRFGNFE